MVTLTKNNDAMEHVNNVEYVFTTTQWLTILTIITGSIIFLWRTYNGLKRSDSKNMNEIGACQGRIGILEAKADMVEKNITSQHNEIIHRLDVITDIQEANRKLISLVDKKLDSHLAYEEGKKEAIKK